MKQLFVKTENAKRFRGGIAMLEGRGAAESGLMLVSGRPGEGKTTTVMNWAAEVGAARLTAYPKWTVERAMRELAGALSIPVERGYEARIEEMIAEHEIPIIVDEAGYALDKNAACLERLRHITDKSGTLMVLVMMQKHNATLSRIDQLASRISWTVEFKPSALADVAAACAQLAERVVFADDLVERIHRETNARMRLVMTAIARCEAVARRQNLDRIAAEHMAGMPLCEDFSVKLMKSGGGLA